MMKACGHESTQHFPHIVMPSTKVTEILPTVTQDKAHFLPSHPPQFT
jgi:hypothetical protein